jgi:sugar phosphate isomerase/epimerase
MKLGCCTSIDNAAVVHAAGFDYIECGLVSLIPEADDATFAPVLESYRAAPLPVLAFNLFLPGDLKVVGPDVDWARVEHYVETALPRAQTIGAQTIVFGSGRSRSVPDGFSRSQAVEQLVRFLRKVADVAERTGITIAIEPLNRRESNIINSVTEGVELAQQVDRAPIRVLADFYHMDEENEPLEHLVQCQDWLAHVHVADTNRGAPGSGEYPYGKFAEQLRMAGYTGLISVECRWEDFESETVSAERFLRRTFAGG